MASKLTSQAPCIHRSNEGNFEWGGVGAKGGFEKEQWDAGRHGEAWLDGFYRDKSLFAITCNSGASHTEDPQSLCKREHAELDWLSKEMAFQEFISSDRPTPWLDLETTRSDLFNDEPEADIFTAVAALFRDWCIVEKDLPESVVNEKNRNFDGGCKNHVYFGNTRLDSGEEAEFFTSLLVQSDNFQKSCLDFSLERVLKECYRSHLAHSGSAARECACYPPHAFGLKAYKDVNVCERSNMTDYPLQEQAGIYGNLLQFNSKPSASKDNYVRAAATKDNMLAVAGNLNDCTGLHRDLDLCSIFGKQIPDASRYSFGRDSNRMSVADAEVSEISGVSDNLEESKSSWKDSMALGCIGNYEGEEVEEINLQGDDLVPEGLLYALSYMNLRDLLKMEQVCRSMRSRIKNDVLLWQRLHVELPMSSNLTDEILLELASRSRGQLQCLSLVDCTRVTEAALEQVLLLNPRLLKLSLPGCSRISADAVVRMVEGHTNQRFSGAATLKQLRVRNMDGFTKEHLEKLQKMVGVKTQEHLRKPYYYHQKHQTSVQDDERAIDVEECPICTNIRLVYDCTRERCQQRNGVGTPNCRACILCIVRCEACGRCITDNNYEETFALDVLCSCCWLGSPKCAECNRPSSDSHAHHFNRSSETSFVSAGPPTETKGSTFSVCA